jgi:hypothetical protein
MSYLTAAHGGALGDVIYSLPTLIFLTLENKCTCKLLLKIGKASKNYPGAKSPVFMISENDAQQLLPLLNYQDYLFNCGIYNNEQLDLDLDDFRQLKINHAIGHLPRHYFYCFRAHYDLSKPWIFVDDIEKHDRVVVARSERYRNLNFDYSFLNDFDPVFIGTDSEYKDIKKYIPTIEREVFSDHLSLARFIAGSKFFIGNQSFPFAIAEAIKVPRLLEVCPFAPNVVVHGNNAYDCYTHEAAQEIIAMEIM